MLGFPFVYLNVLKELGRGREPAEAQPGPSSLLGAASRGFGSARCPVRPPVPVPPAVQAGCRVGRGRGPMELAAIKKKKNWAEIRAVVGLLASMNRIPTVEDTSLITLRSLIHPVLTAP